MIRQIRQFAGMALVGLGVRLMGLKLPTRAQQPQHNVPASGLPRAERRRQAKQQMKMLAAR